MISSMRSLGMALAAVTLSLPLQIGGEAVAGGSVVNMETFGSDDPVLGASTLMRYDDAVDMTISTTGLEPGHAYSVWWVIFNNPEECSGGCSGDQLGIPAIDGVVIWATGGIVGNGGHITFHATLAEGDTSGDQPFTLPGGFDLGLVDASTAEIHVVVRTHGVALDGGDLDAQLTTFAGGCGGTPDPCADLQFAVHLP